MLFSSSAALVCKASTGRSSRALVKAGMSMGSASCDMLWQIVCCSYQILRFVYVSIFSSEGERGRERCICVCM